MAGAFTARFIVDEESRFPYTKRRSAVVRLLIQESTQQHVKVRGERGIGGGYRKPRAQPIAVLTHAGCWSAVDALAICTGRKVTKRTLLRSR